LLRRRAATPAGRLLLLLRASTGRRMSNAACRPAIGLLQCRGGLRGGGADVVRGGGRGRGARCG